jgi:hypothetical protein
MKCRFLVPTKPLNPAWSQKDFFAAQDAGVPYNVPRHLSFAAGYTVEDPNAWIHCCPGDMNSAPIAEPVDDECRAKVKEWMEIHRPAGIAQIKAQLEQIDLLTNDDDKGRLLALGRDYGLIGKASSGGRSETVPQPDVAPAESPETATTAAFDPETN